ncbi:hypothetical protein BHYA_0616g00010 [Botrytis hyacinthi]|uniref:SRR1-like domain-containing protein n=1 Tax=Botrytis hyacinthi TaxID=278943 RepID=A0A4Z1G8X6_9HELO|nr:hypothetical protein BHYA_0616g00010 [Botrytis hyacinthi]
MYRLRDVDRDKMRALLDELKKGKIRQENVVCIALGTFHEVDTRDREGTSSQFAALVELIERLGLPKIAKKVI